MERTIRKDEMLMGEHVPEYAHAQFGCPECRSALTTSPEGITCAACCRVWQVPYGIPRFGDKEQDWSVFPKEVASAVTEHADRTSWHEAIEAYATTIGRYTLDYIRDEARADCM